MGSAPISVNSAFERLNGRDPKNPRDADSGEGERVLKLLLAEGLPVKQAAKLASQITGMAKNALYERALALKS